MIRFRWQRSILSKSQDVHILGENDICQVLNNNVKDGAVSQPQPAAHNLRGHDTIWGRHGDGEEDEGGLFVCR